MVAILVFLFAWLGGIAASNSVTIGFHAAAVVFLGWSCLWTFVMFVAALLDKIKFASFLFWNELGLTAAACLAIGRTPLIIVGIIFWIISIIVEIMTIPDPGE